MSQIDIGDAIRLSTTFKDLSENAVDPTSVLLEIKLPDNSIVSYLYLENPSVVKDSIGNYHLDFLITQSGTHSYKWTGSGTVYAAEEAQFFVRRSQF
jgi:hypothetical protein